MKKKVLLALPLFLIGFNGASPVTAQGDCEQMSVPPVCQAGRRININNNSKKISPRNLCAAPGDVIQVNVTPAGTTASIDGKSGGWPSGMGSSFTITAPEQGTYDYDVTFEDGHCIDPRISVD
jgi:plastocyanin